MLDILLALLIIAFTTLGLRFGPQPRKRDVLTFAAAAGVFATAYSLMPQGEVVAGIAISGVVMATLAALAMVFTVRLLVRLITAQQTMASNDRSASGVRAWLFQGTLVTLTVIAVIVALGKWPADGIGPGVASPAFADANEQTDASGVQNSPLNLSPERPPRPVAWTVVPNLQSTGITRLFTGTVRAGERAPLAFEVTGTIVRIDVRVGERVSRGQPLATLDDTALGFAVEERRAALVEAEAVLREARINFDRKQTLFERNVESEAAVDNARALSESAAARVDAARSALARAQDTLADATLIAPYDGVIAAQLAEPSQTVSAGAPVLAIETANTRAEIVIDVPESVVGSVAVGDRHQLLGGETPTSATVTEIGSRQTGQATFPVTLELAADAAVRPGATRRIALSVSAAAPGARIPLAALVPGTGHAGGHVFVLEPTFQDGVATARQTEVSVVTFGTDNAQVAGIAPGARIATRGAAFLTDGQSVALIGKGVDRFEEFGAPNPVSLASTQSATMLTQAEE